MLVGEGYEKRFGEVGEEMKKGMRERGRGVKKVVEYVKK